MINYQSEICLAYSPWVLHSCCSSPIRWSVDDELDGRNQIIPTFMCDLCSKVIAYILFASYDWLWNQDYPSTLLTIKLDSSTTGDFPLIYSLKTLLWDISSENRQSWPTASLKRYRIIDRESAARCLDRSPILFKISWSNLFAFLNGSDSHTQQSGCTVIAESGNPASVYLVPRHVFQAKQFTSHVPSILGSVLMDSKVLFCSFSKHVWCT